MQRKPILIAVIVTGMLITAAPAAQANETELASDVLDTLTVESQTDDYNAADDRPDDWAQANDNPGDYSTTRDTILARDMTDVTYNDKHQVATGTLHDPYTGTTINFKRGQTTSNAVQIDHVVAFGEAWESGLGDDDEQTVERYYNDPYVLLAVDGPSNNGKQDSDAAEWLPSKVDADGKDTYDCYYVARQIAVKDKYDLSVDKAEKNAMSDVLATCPAQTIPGEQDGAYWESVDAGDSETLPGDVNGDGKYTIDDIPDIQLVNLDEQPIDGFDYRKHVYDLNEETLHAQFRNCPNGWDVTAAAISNNTGQEIHGDYVLSPDGQVVTAYYFTNNQGSPSPDADMNGDGEYTIDDFTGVGFTVDGNPLDGFSPDTHEYTLPDGGEHDIKASGYPSWLHVEAKNPSSTADKGFRSVTHMFTSPDLRTTVSYRFTWNVPVEQMPGDVDGDGEYTTGDLTGLTAVVDGEPYKEFTPDTDSYKLPDGDHTVTIAGTPDGWTMTPGTRSSQTPMPDGPIVTTTTYAFTYTAPNGVTVASYTFTWGTVEHTDDGDDDTSDTPPVVDDTDTDNPDTNAGTDTVPDATDTDDPDSGNTTETPADQLASTGAPITGIGAFTLAMLCCGAALGVLLRHRTRN